jgi:hypothetical protein
VSVSSSDTSAHLDLHVEQPCPWHHAFKAMSVFDLDSVSCWHICSLSKLWYASMWMIDMSDQENRCREMMCLKYKIN